jgi:hypothetical protein
MPEVTPRASTYSSKKALHIAVKRLSRIEVSGGL